MDIATFVVATLALIVSGFAYWASHRSARAAEVSAQAAVDSADQGRRSADAAVQGVEIAAASLALQQRAMERKPQLAIQRVSSQIYRLVNTGTAPAMGISLAMEDPSEIIWDEPLGDQLAHGDSRRFMCQYPGSPPERLSFRMAGHEDLIYVVMPTQ
ncbi:hypothetical protein [Streptomyces omiyaensis]|uniref:Secreted protein n=1 Tax=Streptomyces omiyaensis TaxID=68247 RepID=A0ABW7BP37_9ACTN